MATPARAKIAKISKRILEYVLGRSVAGDGGIEVKEKEKGNGVW